MVLFPDSLRRLYILAAQTHDKYSPMAYTVAKHTTTSSVIVGYYAIASVCLSVVILFRNIIVVISSRLRGIDKMLAVSCCI